MKHIRSFVVAASLSALMFFVVGVPGLAEAQDSLKDTTKMAPAMKAGADSAKAAAAKAEEMGKAKVTPAAGQMEDTAKATHEKMMQMMNDSAKAGHEQMKMMDDTAKATHEQMKKMMNDTTKAGHEQMKKMKDTAAAAPMQMKDTAKAATTPAEKPAPAPQEKAVNPDAPYEYITFDEGEKPLVVMETSMGTIEIELWPDVAPKHVQSFVHLIKTGFYDSLTFHRIVPGFVIQGGDPLGNGTGGPGYNVPAEFSNLPHEDGILSMARSSDPNSAGSQFFICLGRLLSLDNKYTIFGKVVTGLDVAHKIEKVPTQSERPKTPVYMTKVTVKEAATAGGTK